MKYNLYTILLLSIFCIATSCNDSLSFEDDKALKSELKEGDLMSKKECFEFEFPIGLVFPDDNIESVESEEQFYSVLKEWYESNPKEKEKPSLQYPVQLNFKKEISKTISNEKEMLEVKKYCDIKGDKKECFTLIYPLSYEMPDESVISGDDKDELNSAMKAWYEANPDSKEKPRLVYPVDVKFEDGSIKTIGDEDEMIVLKKDC